MTAPEGGGAAGPDPDRIGDWIAESIDASARVVSVAPLSGGNSSGALRVDFSTESGPRALVLRAPSEAIVYRNDAVHEALFLRAVYANGGPVPAVVAIDADGSALGRPCFAMELVSGRPIPDPPGKGLHGEGWYRDSTPEVQRALWMSFVDAVATLHRIDPTGIHPDGDRVGTAGFLAYWRASLLDVAPAERVPRQLRLLDWLRDHLPADADAHPAFCMGDARPGNAIVIDDEVGTLVDFEVAWVGNPAADIGYCLIFDEVTRRLVEEPLPGIPSPEETWARWSVASGRPAVDTAYWTAFGAAILCITGTRAMLHWGAPPESVDDGNLVVPAWEALVERAEATR